MTDIYTTSNIGTFQACPKLYDLRVNKQLESIDRAPYFALGSLFHEAKEAWVLNGKGLKEANEIIKAAELSDEDIRCKVYTMMAAYHRKWLGSELEYYNVESAFMCQTDRGKVLAGICDGIVKHDGRWWILETKTTAALDEGYVSRMKRQRQVLLYTYAIKRLKGEIQLAGHPEYNRDIAGVLYDFIQKPPAKRKKATPPEKRRYTKDGELYKAQRETDESDVFYMNRMHDWYQDNGDAAMQRVEVVITDRQLDEFEKDLHKAIWLLERLKSKEYKEEFGEDAAWPESKSACHAYNRPCEFKDYCHSDDSPIVLKNFYRKREKKFSEFKENIDDNTTTN